VSGSGCVIGVMEDSSLDLFDVGYFGLLQGGYSSDAVWGNYDYSLIVILALVGSRWS
jgi:hypothetical protein